MTTIQDLQQSFMSLQEVSDSQFRTIVELRKQVESLKLENESLKNQLPRVQNIQEGNPDDIDDEQFICMSQLAVLRASAQSRELTLEEAKKFQIYTDILESIKKNKPNTENISVERMPVEDLLRLVEGGESDNAS